jgi:uncharacterized SAM-binding protein YcdF (DUF218 family)
MKMSSDDLFFYAAKILGYFLMIDNLLVIGVFVAIALFWRKQIKVAKRVSIALLAAFLFFSNSGISYAALRTLEDQYPVPEISCDDEIAGVIVLGGGLNPGLLAEQRNQPQLNGAGERITKALEILIKCRDFRLLYSTFSGSLRPEGWSESESAQVFLKEQGVPESRTIFENESRNTFENAKYSAAFAEKEKRWVLVTSASHLPRAVTTFERFGWRVIPYPVDYQSETSGGYLDFNRGLALANWNNVIHERIGSFVYRLRSTENK